METYEIYAIKYASHDRSSNHNFIGGDDHASPMPLDYFVWLIKNHEHTVLVDTGFGEAAAQKRKRRIFKPVELGINSLGISPESISDVIITHMHYDHAGNLDLFPNATFHIQDQEIEFVTGRCMCHDHIRAPYDEEDVVSMVRNVYRKRVHFHDGDEKIFEGLEVYKIGGHTKGLQCVKVSTQRGNVILASDASHFYANILERRPFPIVFNLADMMEGFNKIEELADSPEHIIPGHDPEVLRRYPAASNQHSGWIARLDLIPTIER